MYTLQKYRQVGFAVALVLLAVAAFFIIRPFWQAIAWGSALSIIVYPIHTRLNRRFSDSLSAAITTLLTLLFIILPLIAIGLAVFSELNQFLAVVRHGEEGPGHAITLGQFVDEANMRAAPVMESVGVHDFDLRELVEKNLQPLIGNAPRLATTILFGILTFIFALLLLFFILRDSYKLRPAAVDLIPLPPQKTVEIIQTIYNTVHATFYGIVLVALVQGSMLGVTFWALGLPAPLLWGMACVLLCMIPFAGAPIIWIPTSLLLISQGDWTRAIILAAIGLLVIGMVDNILRPIIIGARVDLPFVAVFFSIFGGIFVLGPVGILVGPVLLSVVLGAIQVLREIGSGAGAVSDVND